MNRKEAASAALDVMRSYRRLMLNDDGTLREDALIVMADLERESRQTRTTAALDRDGRIDPLGMAMNEGRRALFLHVRRRLFTPLEGYIEATEDI